MYLMEYVVPPMGTQSKLFKAPLRMRTAVAAAGDGVVEEAIVVWLVVVVLLVLLVG